MKATGQVRRVRGLSLVRRLRNQSGQSTIELALLIPAFFCLLFGTFAFSIVLFYYENATFACKVAARYASLHSSTSLSPSTSTDIQNIVKVHLWAPASSSVVGVSWSSGNTIGSTVTVSVNATYSVGIPFSTLSVVKLKTSAQRTIMR